MAENPKLTVIDRTTGETKQVDAPAVTDDFLSGKVGLQPGSTVPVVMDGQVGDVPAEKLYNALQSGWKIAGKLDVVKDEASNSPLRAAVEGAGRSLSFGVTDLLARAAGADPDALEARAATGAGALGEGTGMLGQLLYGAVGAGVEGTGLAARALGAAMKPTQLVEGLGKMAAARTESALTGMGLKATAAKAIGYGVAGATEGAVVGGMTGMSEAALGNTDLNAEILLSAAAHGAGQGMLWGGGAGLLLGSVAAKLEGKSVPIRETREDLNELLTREGVDTSQVNTSLLDKISRGLGKLTQGDKVDDLAKVNNRTAMRIFEEGEPGIQQTAQKLTNTLDEVRTVAKELDEFSVKSRAKLVRDALPDGPGAGDAAVAKIADVAGTIRRDLDTVDMNSEMLGLGTKGGQQAGAKLRAAVDEAEARVFKAAGVDREYVAMVESGTDSLGAPKFERVEKTRTLDDLAGLYDNGPKVVAAVHDAMDQLRMVSEQANKAGHFQASREAVHDALRDGETFGDAARIHQLLDDAAVKRADAQSFLDKAFRSENGKILPESVQNHIRSVINVNTDTSIAKLRDFAQSNKDLLQTLHAAGADVSSLGSAKSKLEAFSKQVGDIEKPLRERISVYNAARNLARGRAQSMASASNVMTYSIGSAMHEATGLSGAPLGLAAAGAFTALTDPARLAVNRARIGAAIRDRAEQLNDSVYKLVTGGAPGNAARRGSRLTAQMVTSKSYAERVDAFRQRMDEVHNAASPNGQQEHADASQDFSDAAPEHANALAAKQDLATRMLLSAIPQPLPTPGGLGLRPPTYTDSAIRRFARLDTAIQDPQTIIHDAMNGKVSGEARQVLHTLYPQLALTVQAQLMQAMDAGDKFKLSPTRERAIKLLLTPIGSNDMQRLNQLQSVITMPAQQQQGGSPKVSPTTDVMSAADSLLKQ